MRWVFCSEESCSSLAAVHGLGELPFIQQATWCVWKTKWTMQHHAYTDATHKNVIRLTHKHPWYSE